MPKANGLTREQRQALMADSSDDVTEPQDIAPEPVPPSYQPEPAVLPAPVSALDPTALIQMLTAALQQSGTTTAQAIRDGLAQATTLAREPIPENKIAPGFSVYAHPLGDQAHPRTKLRCPMFLGVYDERGRAVSVFEIFQDTCTELERTQLNLLTPGSTMVTRNDGQSAFWKIVEEKDALNQVTRMIIAVPTTWLAADQQAQMPGQPQFLQQLTAPTLKTA